MSKRDGGLVLQERQSTAPVNPAVPAVEVRGVSKRFGSTVAVDNVSVTLAEGEFLTLVGPSGCGKSTLLRMVAGLLEPDAGEILLGGRTVSGPGRWVPPEDRAVGLVFQENTLFPHLTVAGNIGFGLARRSKGEIARRVAEVLELVELPSYGDRYPHELSGGERQRVALARAIAPQPTVLLLDEPFANLDPNLRAQVRAHTVEILRRAKASALFGTHDQQEAMSVGDRVAVMGAGRIEQIGTPKSVFHHPETQFVASSLGEAYFLPVRYAGNGTLHTEAGSCPAPQGLSGENLEIMVRPHDVTFVPDPHGDSVVTGVEFLGAFLLYEVQLSSGRRLRCLMPHTAEAQPGDPVRVQHEHGHVPVVLP
ncbi:MAG TPA: ABC transporter ATP-binding protein, partial [Actinomycetota bacterium]|nr:ABC transporter ATP-binding protein [Actinomycetota bacterium]